MLGAAQVNDDEVTTPLRAYLGNGGFKWMEED
jgi:hypothetical protein